MKAAIVDGLGRLSHTDNAVFNSIVVMIKTEKSKTVRGSMAMYLADNLNIYPASRKVLNAFLKDASNKATFRADVTSKMRAKDAASRAYN